MVQIIPTLFSTTEKEYKERLEKLQSSGFLENGWVQLDLMDNRFVPNLSIDLDIVKKSPLNYQVEAQLMVEKPEEWITGLLEIGVERIIFPVEIDVDFEKLIARIKKAGIAVGLSVNPETDWRKLEPYLDKLDAVLFMSVKPGLEGQEFSVNTFDKIREVKQKRPDVLVGVDGGINDTNVKRLVDAGADYLAIGSFLFTGDIDENIEKIWEAISR